MRKRTSVRAALLCSAAAVAVAPATAIAAPHPVHNDGLTIASTPSSIVSGQGVLIYGNLKGANVNDQTIRLYHRIGNAPTFTYVGKTTTDSDGFYKFTRAEGVVITNRNWYAEGPNGAHSKTIHEHVSSIISLSESTPSTTAGSRVLFSGSVSPDHAHQRVLIQEQDATNGNGWKTIAAGRTNGASDFAIAKAIRPEGDYTLRAYIAGDARNTAGASTPVTLAVQQRENPSFTIGSSASEVTVGSPVTISGTLYQFGSTSSPQANTGVTLYASTDGHRFVEVGTGSTDTNGGYSFAEMPQNNTVYKVVSATTPAARTANLYQAVSDTISLSASSTSAQVGSPVTFSGSVSPEHVGHYVMLQEQTPRGTWQTVEGIEVGAGGQYSLAYTFGKPSTYNMRMVISGGPLNVGAVSTPVTVTVSGYAPASSLPAAS